MTEAIMTDEYLVKLAQQGDFEAEETLMRRYKEVARNKSKLYFMAGADEEDVVQEGMIGLFKAVRQYNPEKNAAFSTFANICITRQIISAIRTASRQKHQILNGSLSLSNPVGTDKDDLCLEDTVVNDGADNPETLLVLDDIIDYMLQNNDEVFSQFELEVFRRVVAGKERDAIAEELDKNRKSVDNAMSRIRNKVASFIWD
ncbi:MAG: sigma-70 family RNA polymerase sigma factor [Eubacterium sp.]|nr:sigma-70 family RNA polymerase sigma factor [Candidatus Colimonas fimequi]